MGEEVERNSWEVLKFLEVWHHVEPSVGQNEEPFDRKHKGSSRPPCSDAALDLIHANAEASSVLSPILEELEASKASYSGIRASTLLGSLREHPGLLPAIRAEQGATWQALRAFCYLVAQAVASKMDGPDAPYRLTIRLSRKEVEGALGDPREKTNGKVRTYTAHDAYRIIDAEIERLMEEGYSEMAARQYLMDRGTSAPRISRARAFVREERGVA
jgi:hypothetical protein